MNSEVGMRKSEKRVEGDSIADFGFRIDEDCGIRKSEQRVEGGKVIRLRISDFGFRIDKD